MFQEIINYRMYLLGQLKFDSLFPSCSDKAFQIKKKKIQFEENALKSIGKNMDPFA